MGRFDNLLIDSSESESPCNFSRVDVKQSNPHTPMMAEPSPSAPAPVTLLNTDLKKPKSVSSSHVSEAASAKESSRGGSAAPVSVHNDAAYSHTDKSSPQSNVEDNARQGSKASARSKGSSQRLPFRSSAKAASTTLSPVARAPVSVQTPCSQIDESEKGTPSRATESASQNSAKQQNVAAPLVSATPQSASTPQNSATPQSAATPQSNSKTPSYSDSADRSSHSQSQNSATPSQKSGASRSSASGASSEKHSATANEAGGAFIRSSAKDSVPSSRRSADVQKLSEGSHPSEGAHAQSPASAAMSNDLSHEQFSSSASHSAAEAAEAARHMESVSATQAAEPSAAAGTGELQNNGSENEAPKEKKKKTSGVCKLFGICKKKKTKKEEKQPDQAANEGAASSNGIRAAESTPPAEVGERASSAAASEPVADAEPQTAAEPSMVPEPVPLSTAYPESIAIHQESTHQSEVPISLSDEGPVFSDAEAASRSAAITFSERAISNYSTQFVQEEPAPQLVDDLAVGYASSTGKKKGMKRVKKQVRRKRSKVDTPDQVTESEKSAKESPSEGSSAHTPTESHAAPDKLSRSGSSGSVPAKREARSTEQVTETFGLTEAVEEGEQFDLLTDSKMQPISPIPESDAEALQRVPQGEDMPMYKRRVLLDLREREKREEEELAREWQELTFKPKINPYEGIGNRVEVSERAAPVQREEHSFKPTISNYARTHDFNRERVSIYERLYNERKDAADADPNAHNEYTFHPAISEQARKSKGDGGNVIDRLYRLPQRKEPEVKASPKRKRKSSANEETVYERLYNQRRSTTNTPAVSKETSPRRALVDKRDSVYERLYRLSQSPPRTSETKTSPDSRYTFKPQITEMARRQSSASKGRKDFSERLYRTPTPTRAQTNSVLTVHDWEKKRRDTAVSKPFASSSSSEPSSSASSSATDETPHLTPEKPVGQRDESSASRTSQSSEASRTSSSSHEGSASYSASEEQQVKKAAPSHSAHSSSRVSSRSGDVDGKPNKLSLQHTPITA